MVLQEVARIVSWLNHVQWKQLGWTERRKERCYLKKHLRQGGGGGGELTEKQEVWLESSRFDWKILLSGAFRCADRSLKKSREEETQILQLHKMELLIVSVQV